MKAQHQDLPVERFHGEQRSRQPLAIFSAGELIERRGSIGWNLDGRWTIVVSGSLEHLIQAGHGAFAAQIDDQVAGHGEEPGIEARLAVELPAAHQNPHPDFLKEILGLFAVAGQVQEVAEQAMLIAHDQLVEQPGILALQPLGDSQTFLADQFLVFPGLTDSSGGNSGVRSHHLSVTQSRLTKLTHFFARTKKSAGKGHF